MSVMSFEIDDRIGVIRFDDPSAPVNTMSAAWQAEFSTVLDEISGALDALDGVIVTSAKPGHFFAGADVKSLLNLTPADAGAVFAQVEAIKAMLNRLETLPIPVVAALNGTALGGGFEIALACHQRFCVATPTVQLGLPEVSLGLLPGGGGLTKMVRLLGLVAALPILTEGKIFTPEQAAALGLVQLVADEAALLAAARTWIASTKQPVQPWRVKGYKMPGGTPSSPGVAQALLVAPAMVRQKTQGCYPAPEAILACAVEGAQVGFDTALRLESRHFATLATGAVAQNLIRLFLERTAAKSSPRQAGGRAAFKPRKVGILGAGMMGGGIAYANAVRGVDCVLKDVSLAAAERGKAYSKNFADKRIKRKRMSEAEREALLARITPTVDEDGLAGCDLIIEAVFENAALKAQVIAAHAAHVTADGVFASNSSTLPMTGLANSFPDPTRFIGLHFFSPVERMELLEIIRGAQTSDETVAKALDYAKLIGKLPIVVNDRRGFYTSRTFGTFVMEGATMLAEGIPAPAIERAALMVGMPVGPLAVLDETSLSLSVHVLEETRRAAEAGGHDYAPSQGELLVERMVRDFNRPGRAGGGGFYDYPADGPKHLWPGLAAHFGKIGIAFEVAHLGERFLYRQALETLRCLHEKVLISGRDANLGSIFGIGFPAWTGGAWRFIEAQGLASFTEHCAALAARYGERFAPPDLPADWRIGA